MKKRIIINEGDEYRFKTEKEYENCDFFCDVYQKADMLIEEIITSMKSSKETIMESKSQFYGLSNNIISFCAGRGEGKTSALQSFVTQLSNSDNNRNFLVLDSIDPSALNSGESIIKVLISRLFIRFEGLYKKVLSSPNLNYDNNLLISNKTAIIEKFQVCFNNVTYLEQSTPAELYQDDLEYLAQLGDSRNLRSNLFFLIDEILRFYNTFFSDKEKRQTEHLIITIDDADLSMGDIFKTCEDIRNFFSIPNVIVLMAADFEQLRIAIYQKYLKHYNTLLISDKKLKYKSKCYSMATKFMEKMFPSGHRIVLPKIDSEMQENTDSIYLEYHTSDNNFDTVEWENCKDMQDQLLKSLYLRTGILLPKHMQKLHPFLPHTLRELTHFLKLLKNMKHVNFNQACTEGLQPNAETDMPNLIQWKGNLDTIKQYFMTYWIQKHLKSSQIKIIHQIDNVLQYSKPTELANILLVHINEKKKYNDIVSDIKKDPVDFSELLSKFINIAFKSEYKFRHAIYIYFSIVLNTNFVKEFIQQTKKDNFITYVGKSINIDISNTSHAPYEWIFDNNNFMEYSENKLTALDTSFLKIFCNISENTNNKGTKNMNTYYNFSIFNPITQVIRHTNWLLNETQDTLETDNTQNSLNDVTTNNFSIPPADYNTLADVIGVLINAKDIICNLELLTQINSTLTYSISNEVIFDYDTGIIKYYTELYDILDKNIDSNTKYLNYKCNIGKFLGKKISDYYKPLCYAYLSNKNTYIGYFNHVKNKISELIKLSNHNVNLLSVAIDDKEFKDNAIDTYTEIKKCAIYSDLLDIAQKDSAFKTLTNIQDTLITEWKNLSTNANEDVNFFYIDATSSIEKISKIINDYKNTIDDIKLGEW